MENDSESPLIIIFLAKLTLRCHIPPSSKCPPYSYNQFWCGASYLYGGV